MSGFYKAVEEKISKVEQEFTFSVEEITAEISDLSPDEIKSVFLDLMRVDNVS